MSSPSKKSNIVLVNPDQMRWDYMTPAGHPFIETEHLSRLADMGTYFSHAFCASPMCGPSRTSVITGQYPCEHRVRNYWGTMDPEHPNFLSALGQAGYRRGLFGKDHIIREDAIGILYDEGEDICIGNMDDHPDYTRSWNSGTLEKSSQWNLTERLTDAGIEFIERQAQNEQPFFVTLNFQDPHPYFTCPDPYAGMFSPDQFELPPNFRREAVEGEIRRMTLWREHSRSLEASDRDFKNAMAMYCGQIRYVDDRLGRILKTLETLNILDNTIVLFWSDHGEFVGDYGVTHKMPAFYESMVRVPLLVWDPSGKLPRGTQHNLVEVMDLFASILDLVGLLQPEGSRAYSLLEPNYQPRRDVYSEGGLYIQQPEAPIPGLNLRAPGAPTQYSPGAMIRTYDWKLCVYSCDRGQLFDLNNDPYERNNLYHDPEHAGQRLMLTERLLQRQLCQGQAPEHLPRALLDHITEQGRPVWENSEEILRIEQGYDNPSLWGTDPDDYVVLN
ncbi:MAG: sulfatase-like hydrolase/transferase [bacterium]|nr:sulfatase-like hydrolase/transferase [bacterium]